MKKIVITADSPADIPEDYANKNNIKIIPFIISIEGKEYLDGIDIDVDTMYRFYYDKEILPMTAAPSPADYHNLFNQYDEDYEIIHFSMSSSMSSAYQNAKLAANAFDNVHIIDSGHISSGIAIMVYNTQQMIDEKRPLIEVLEEARNMRYKVDISFVVGQTEFLKAGGRVSTLVAVGVNALNIKPSIVALPDEGSLTVGKKYRGQLGHAFTKYVKDKLKDLNNINENVIYITHSGVDQDIVDSLYDMVKNLNYFKEIKVTRAGNTISSHCGPDSLGIIYLNK